MEKEEMLTGKKLERKINTELIREIARLISDYKPAATTKPETGDSDPAEWEEELTRITNLLNDRKEKILIEEIRDIMEKPESEAETDPGKLPGHGTSCPGSYIKFLQAREAKKNPPPERISLEMSYDYEILRSALSEAGATLKREEEQAAVLPYRALEVLRTQERLKAYISKATGGTILPDDITIKIMKPPASIANPRKIYTWKEHVNYLGRQIWQISEAPPAIIVIKKQKKCPETLDKRTKMWYINSEEQHTAAH